MGYSMDDFQKQQAERDHLYIPAAVGHEESDNFITKGFTENTRGASGAAMFTLEINSSSIPLADWHRTTWPSMKHRNNRGMDLRLHALRAGGPRGTDNKTRSGGAFIPTAYRLGNTAV